jgi:hypothetical protein
MNAQIHRGNTSMRSHRHSKSSAGAPDGEPDTSAARDGKQTVDSRAYAFAYLIRESSQLPADFDVEQDFEYALFLPRELVPRFETPRYEPRLLLAWPDRLSLYAHPSCGLRKTTIHFADISYIEIERFLADCSLMLVTPRGVLHLPFHGRDEEYVGTFLRHIQQALLSISKRPRLLCDQRAFGPEPDFKFEQIEAIMKVDAEAVVTRFFVPPREVVKPRLFRQEFSWTFGSEIVLTRNELYLFSDDKDGYRQLYGFRASWVPLRNIVDIVFTGTPQSIAIQLLGDFSLKVPVPSDLLGEAKKFVPFVRKQIRSCHS